MFQTLARLTLAAITVSTAESIRRQWFQRRLGGDMSPSAKQPMQAWEGEGGALPGSGSQMGPGPALP